MVEFELVKPSFKKEFIDDIYETSKKIFGEEWADLLALKWRLTNMPDITVFSAISDGNLVGFKIGYAASHKLYYSWLGGVAPEFRRKGIANRLMEIQHDWLMSSEYQIVETYPHQNNNLMIQLNINSGFKITGNFQKGNEPYLIMQKEI